MTNPYKQYSVNDFDNFDCLKLSKGIYWLLAFVMRGYVVWLASVTNLKDGASFVQFIFPDTILFYLSLVSGLVGLFVLLVLSQRKPGAPSWVERIWPKTRLLLISALLFDLTVNIAAYAVGSISSLNWLVCQCVIVIGFIWFCFRSKRLEINLTEFPQKVEVSHKRKHRSDFLPKLKEDKE